MGTINISYNYQFNIFDVKTFFLVSSKNFSTQPFSLKQNSATLTPSLSFLYPVYNILYPHEDLPFLHSQSVPRNIGITPQVFNQQISFYFKFQITIETIFHQSKPCDFVPMLRGTEYGRTYTSTILFLINILLNFMNI